MEVREGPDYSGPGYSDSLPGRILMFAGHYSPWALAVSVVFSAASDLTRFASGPLNWISTIAGGWWIASLYADGRHHNENLCTRCARVIPLDPEAEVRRWRLLLRAHHSKVLSLVLMISIASWVVIGIMVWRYQDWGWPGYLLDTAVLLAASAFWAGIFKHRRLEPWCPFCHWDDGGSKEAAEPEPDPAVSA